MLSTAIPKDIREYKEKLVAGFTARQLLSTMAALAVCVPLYIYGRRFLPEEVISWTVIAVALPLGAIGFIKYNGMPAEKFIVCIVLFLLYPVKRVYMTSNCLRNWQEQTRKEDLMREGYTKSNGKLKGKARKYLYNASVERAFLLEEAEKNGTLDQIDLLDLDSRLLTAKPRPRRTAAPNAGKGTHK